MNRSNNDETGRLVGLTFLIGCIIGIVVLHPHPALIILAIVALIALMGWIAGIIEDRSITRRLRREAAERVKAWKRVEEANQ